jgi:hypothetical protein
MAILQTLLSKAIKTPRDLRQVLIDRTVAANLSRQSPLKPDPLTINVKVTVVLSTISLDTG